VGPSRSVLTPRRTSDAGPIKPAPRTGLPRVGPVSATAACLPRTPPPARPLGPRPRAQRLRLPPRWDGGNDFPQQAPPPPAPPRPGPTA